MPLQLDLAPLAGFVALMATAAFEDFRRLVIPNLVIVGLCILWPFHLATAPGATLASGLTAIGCGLAVFFAGALLFARGPGWRRGRKADCCGRPVGWPWRHPAAS